MFRLLDPWMKWHMPASGERRIYLTFDDGPHPELTPWVMDQLEHFNARATFFCVGDNVRKYPQTYREILARGHRTGNHTFNHLSGWATSNKQYLENIAECRLLVDSELFRPPYGKIGPGQLLMLRRNGYRVVMWSLLSRDYEAGLNRKESLRTLVDHTRNGSIVLFHDNIKARENLEYLLPAYLEACARNRFQFAVL